jgi:hypothetical protein
MAGGHGMISMRSISVNAGLVAAMFALSGCSEPDVFPLSMSETYKRLNSADIQPSSDGMFFGLQTLVGGNSADEVFWSAGGSTEVTCTMHLAKVDETHTRVGVSCKGDSPSDAAAVEKLYAKLRSRVIEMVDATLTGRKFSPVLANGVTAARWPGDGGAAVSQRLEADMREEDRRKAAVEQEREAQLVSSRPEPVQDYSYEDSSGER